MEKREYNRKPLSQRSKVLGPDVADAIEAIVERDGTGLPMAIEKDDLVPELIRLACSDESGEVNEPTRMAVRLMAEEFRSRLADGRLFVSGYQHYHRRSKNPVVPVTNYFFNNVYEEGDNRAYLDAMTPNEVMHSLPKRPTQMRDAETEAKIFDEEGNVAHSGKVAGVVVFPQGQASPLVLAWMDRRFGQANGTTEAALTYHEEVRPGARITNENLRQAAGTVKKIGHTVARMRQTDEDDD
jgi:hypothetical protein